MKDTFYYTLEKIVDLIILNVLFIITCIPVVTIGASLCALFCIAQRMSDNTESYLFRDYLSAWKQNWVKGTIVWVMALLMFFMFRINFFALSLLPEFLFGIMRGIQIFAILAVCGTVQYFFALAFVWKDSIFDMLRRALQLSFKYLPWTTGCLCLGFLPWILIFFVPMISRVAIVCMAVFGFSGISYMEAFYFRRFVMKDE